MRTATTILTTTVLVISVCGCHGAAYEAALAHRQRAIHDFWTRSTRHEAARSANLKRLRQTADELQTVYTKRLELTLERLEARARQDNERWRSEHAKRRDAIQDQAEGHPNWIERFIQAMFY
ncbi:MAG: hypothetical protein ACE5E5_10725 [Phycisphaerae bacterium]